MRTIQGQTKGSTQRIAVIVSRFNEFITKKLLKGCLDGLKKNGIKEANITVAWVPGSFEIPLTALKFASKKNIDAVICLGAVIRGETIHFDLVAQAAKDGILKIGLETGKPVVFGVITTETVNQAYARSEEKGDNKGRDAALTAIEMLNLLKQV